MAQFKDLKNEILKSSQSIPQLSVELLSDKSIKALLRPMTVKEHRELLKAMEKKDEYLINAAFDAILDKCVEKIDDKPFNNDTVYIQDRIYLLMKIQQLTNGNMFKITHICPKTGKIVSGIEVDLDKCMRLSFFSGQSLKKTVEITPSIRLTLAPITRKSEKEIEKFLNKRESIVERRYAAYGAVIEKAEIKNGEVWEDVSDLTFDNKVQIITDYCTSKQLELFDSYIKTLDFGVKLFFHFKTEDYENEEEEANLISFFIM